MQKILIVDDDISIGNLLEELLEGEGYSVSRAYSGTEALMAVEKRRPELILLDLMLPGLNGEELLPLIRDIPVIVVSAKSEPDDKINMLLSGAADYVTKPFNTGELLARIAAALRNAAPGTGDRLIFRDIRLEPASRLATVSGRAVKLTKTEFAILRLLMQNPSQVFAKSLILDKISRDTPDCVESSLKVHISNLRRKLRQVNGSDYIEAVWGIGFKMRES